MKTRKLMSRFVHTSIQHNAMSNEDKNEDWEDLDAIDEEYETWKSNLDQMYGTVFEEEFKESFMTVQWLPGSETSNEGITKQRVIYGTLEQKKNELHVGEIAAQFQGKESQSEVKHETELKTLKKIPHEGDVNRARYNPKKSDIVATANEHGTIQQFNIQEGKKVLQDLKKHETNAFGLAWSSDHQLVTGCDNGLITRWDALKGSVVHTYEVTDPEKPKEPTGVNDIAYQWHENDTTQLFGAVSESGYVHFFDSRQDGPNPANVLKAHDEAANSISFNPFSSYLYATASTDSSVGIWDLRFTKTRLHSLLGHSSSVQSLDWNPFLSNILMSASDDRRVLLWDITRIGQEQTPEDIEDGAPEVLFMHGGHKHSVHDVSWNPEHEWCVASVAGDLSLQIWRPLDQIVSPVDATVKNSQLE
jgi:histone-binding protein RBBP4